MKFFFYLAVFLLVGGLICGKTNPDKSAHVRAVSAAVVKEVQEGDMFNDVKNSEFAALANDIEFVRTLVDRMLVIESYGVLSIGKMRWIDKEYIVSLGILGKVFTFADAKAAKDFISSLEESVKKKINN